MSGSNGASLGDQVDDCLTVSYTIPCADTDNDGICDDEDDCVGEYDDCGVCNGNGQSCYNGITLSIGSVSDGVMELVMDNTMPILGFQFNVSGVDFAGAIGSGGSAGDAGFQVSTGVDGMVLGFSMLGAEIPAGNTVLTTIPYTATDDSACISNEVLALGEWEGGFYEINIGDCVA